jgi:hypothetical protein
MAGLSDQVVRLGPGELAGLALTLGVTLGLMLLIGWTYQATHSGALYTQQFVHTLVIVGMVVSIVLRIVGTNLAAGLAIFGAFSIVRFRNSVPETRDVGFIFLAMVVGLAAGAGQLELSVLTAVVVCATVWVLWRLDAFAPERPSHILRVRASNDIDFDDTLGPIFARHTDRREMIRVESVQGGMLTEITYGIRLKGGISPHDFLAAVQSATGNNRVILVAAGEENR